jgi:hypothetical protein
MRLRNIAAAAALALMAGMASGSKASAAPLGYFADTSNTESSNVQDVRWVCGPNRCWWRPSYYAPAPYYGYYAPRPAYRYYAPRYRYGWYGPRRHWR